MVKAFDNSADFFAKALDHDCIRRHTESLGSECMFGRDPHAFTVNNLSATLSMKKLAMEPERWFGAKGRMDAWTRMDLHSKTVKTKKTREDRLGKTLHTESMLTQGAETSSTSKTRRTSDVDEEHRLVERGPYDLVTVLLLKSVGGQDGHFGAYDKHGDKMWSLLERGNRWRPGTGVQVLSTCMKFQRFHGRNQALDFDGNVARPVAEPDLERHQVQRLQ